MIRRSAAIFLILSATAAHSNEYTEQLENLAQSDLSSWVENADLVSAVRNQNASNADLSQEEIVALDNEWRSQVGAADTPMISEVLGRELSNILRDRKEQTEGLVTEVFVMDNRGLNVGQSDVTSDLWQGDEAKWSQSFGAGVDAIHIGEVELDESTQSYQSQISLAISDPETGNPIGAITFGIDLEYLE